jgi:uncharacterized membrane protein
MFGDRHQAKRPVSALLAGAYGHPLHPALVTVPIGAWVASLVFDIASRLVRDPAFLARGSLWLIGLGIVAALPAALVGFLDLLAIPPGTPASRTALVHMGLNLTVIGGYLGGFLWRRSNGDQLSAVPQAPLALSALCLAALAVAGFLGGKLAFRYGVRVADEATQDSGYRRDPVIGPAPSPHEVPPHTPGALGDAPHRRTSKGPEP